MFGGVVYHCYFFFFNDTATTEIYTLSLHDALPIYGLARRRGHSPRPPVRRGAAARAPCRRHSSEEHTSELQSRPHLVCRLLLEKKKKAGRRDHRGGERGRSGAEGGQG